MGSKIRTDNISKVLSIIDRYKTISRKDIASELGTTTMTASNIVNYLLSENICVEVGKDHTEKRIGRKKSIVKINYDYKNIVGVNIRKVRTTWEVAIGISNLDHSAFVEEEFFYDLDISSDLLFEDIILNINNILSSNGFSHSDILGLGISITGVVDSINGVLINSHSGLKNLSLRALFQDNFDFPVFIINNIKALAAGKLILDNPNEDFFFLRYDEGIGSTVVYNGTIFGERDFSSGKLGHLTIQSNLNKECTCGKINCLESFVHFRELRSLYPIIKGKRTYEVVGDYDKDSTITKFFNDSFKLIALELSNILKFMGLSNIILDGKIFNNPLAFSKFSKEVLHFFQEDDNITIKFNNSKITKSSGAIGFVLFKEFYKMDLL